ncbi:polysaccharide pyruvyl transferase family protein [Bifidobacterium amazonense]|uniref:Polysaccharide pyruvyl transferase family protein n=1 Tax=Bifidobacterium amazonense TaxID=2809027 RepID=A0ABS9VXM7_9BIFI|nr:polysaccharide pyruvyl transferase family protein [Bifidobacterium amazonense]MCH9276848.1 polysaccharide pyruvyl transferase family protein [Bifidobacterium amazonense]
MTKISILTINDPINYGNRLQNYALQRVLKRYGNVNTLNLPNERTSSLIYNIRMHIKNIFRPFLLHCFSLLSDSFGLASKRRINFDKFSNNYIETDKSVIVLRRKYSFHNDCLVIGSDQVWNDQILASDELLPLRLGAFVSNGHVISYAASFGVSQVVPKSYSIFDKYLHRMSAISVREDRGAELVKEISGLDATVVLDPTLMLTTDDWKTVIAGDFVPSNDRYVLTYFLGDPSAQQEHVIQECAKAHGCRVRRMLDLRDPETYVAGPADFVELFSKAEYVFTDSYHACCFSILFEKQFKVFNRANFSGKSSMNSRMQTLFRLFELDDLMDDDAKLTHIDYVHVNQLLDHHRKASREWLDQAMTKIGVVSR